MYINREGEEIELMEWVALRANSRVRLDSFDPNENYNDAGYVSTIYHGIDWVYETMNDVGDVRRTNSLDVALSNHDEMIVSLATSRGPNYLPATTIENKNV